ncbi:hypothetical protein C9374_012782 [Naegleria lovaniensis]|uniref:Uncharacterized protein n=1 Tax=Naegleria lovaniensis TaxID=51637 RepID=A0AA88GCY6_NAELO|nr:uncharacterized protein C9374_012782 [Naegleria lovaniensis]KAG2373180.1 hypothetical protein C9374_012782 [Naegleria lovaniensis]
MQLVITTNKGICSSSKELNEELFLSSHRVKTTKIKNQSYKKVCCVEIRGQFHKTKRVIDQDVLRYMTNEFVKQYSSIDNKSIYHTTLHIYAHDGTFGLRYDHMIDLNHPRPCLRANHLIQILEPYLQTHPECNCIKLHVCFSGVDYNGSVKSYAEQLRDEIEQRIMSEDIPQQAMTVEGVDGWSILAFNISTSFKPKSGEYWSHYVLPRTPELRNIVSSSNNKFSFDPLIVKYDNGQLKRRFTASKN